ncbi:Cof-type HAD-IIB family hydrolase [Paenibacillus validus]|uniref:Cof-type HAD-IIB family hydrolase n=1 Tax=Paenibacillus TaxID=44249 RepID=UPI000FD9FE6C|nr:MULTISPECIES: Cof-type HAD-IIB family hydrolase [Paenibacillus]MED4600140.1 Cof-type HAD-IIB family hydrolase [Paenibacillus validus]MED4607688.1 Cof-type HAD-IIB family hydrolase [Paenibacillus validus]
MDRKRFEGYLLVTDMDGTLLNAQKEISKENLAAIERFVAQGGLFTVATGRIVEPAGYFVKQLPVNTPAILYNGAVIYDYSREEAIWQSELPDAGKAALQQVVEAFPGIGAEIYVQGEPYPYVLRENEWTARHRQIERFPYQPIDDVTKVPPDWLKVLFAWEPERLDQTSEAIVRLTEAAQIEWVRSDDRYFEMLARGATKGHALELLTDKIGIAMERCVAIGDHLNDLEMIRRAGIGVAVENAHPLLIEAANRKGKHHQEHAVADVIEWLEAQAEAEARS